MSELTKEVKMRWTRKGVQNRVARAAAWLDENYPGWAKKIPLTPGRFKINQTTRYEIVNGKYIKCGCVTVHTGIDPDILPPAVAEATLWGDVYPDYDTVQILQTEWENTIRERKSRKVKS